jgi:hypothetical protein
MKKLSLTSGIVVSIVFCIAAATLKSHVGPVLCVGCGDLRTRLSCFGHYPVAR